ncbi:MAG TPA: hypothetical protein VFV02_07720 [Acidimicrobiales bacterium]|nr:hypothetical protein [Acidimicrobiales bacterium]
MTGNAPRLSVFIEIAKFLDVTKRRAHQIAEKAEHSDDRGGWEQVSPETPTASERSFLRIDGGVRQGTS